MTLEQPSPLTLTPIATIHSPFKQKFGTPRQSGLNPSAQAEVSLDKSIVPEGSLEDLEGFSHIWLIFLFHKNSSRSLNGKISPPRLGGKKVGLFSSRSPHRPNPIGLSLVEIESIDLKSMKIIVRGADLIEGTPILDIKPYIPQYDSKEASTPQWVNSMNKPPLNVIWSDEAQRKAQTLELPEPLKNLIQEICQIDHRNAEDKLKNQPDKLHKSYIKNLDISFCYKNNECHLVDIIKKT